MEKRIFEHCKYLLFVCSTPIGICLNGSKKITCRDDGAWYNLTRFWKDDNDDIMNLPYNSCFNLIESESWRLVWSFSIFIQLPVNWKNEKKIVMQLQFRFSKKATKLDKLSYLWSFKLNGLFCQNFVAFLKNINCSPHDFTNYGKILKQFCCTNTNDLVKVN